MYCNPREGLGCIIRFDGNFNVTVNTAYKIVQLVPIETGADTLEGLVFDENGGNRFIYGELLQTAVHEDPEVPLAYCYYRPRRSGR